jgi:hypothetical protein
MKYGLCNLGNSKVTFHKKKCYGLIIYNEIEDLFTILKHIVVSKVITLRNKKLEEYGICDELYLSLLCVIKVLKISKFITYPKGFHDQF